jgi:hypothetical protein
MAARRERVFLGDATIVHGTDGYRAGALHDAQCGVMAVALARP